MAWVGTFTFTGDLSSPLQFVRSLIGDTNSDEPKLYDEQISPFLPGGAQAQANLYLSAAMAAELIDAVSGSGVQSISAGGTSVTFNNKPGTYASLATRLRAMGARSGGAVPYVGGVSRSGKSTIESDTDRVTPAFSRTLGEMDTGSTGYDDRVAS